MTHPAPGGGSRLTDLTLALLAATLLLASLLHTAGRIAAHIAGHPDPTGSLADTLTLFSDPAQPDVALGIPGLPAWLYWTVTGALLVATTTAAWVVRHLRTTATSGHPGRRGRIEGTATGTEIAQVAGRRTIRRRAKTLRPSLANPTAADVGYLLGTAGHRQVWATVEDSILLLGPPRSGKGLHVVINAILDAPGAVITTSTRPDNLTTTLTARQQAGPVAIFDPQQLAAGLPAGLRWSLVRGCEDPHTAMIRAAGLSAATGLTGGGVDNGGFWEAKTRVAVQTLLHAAALDGRDARSVHHWALNPAKAADAVRILHTNRHAAEGWGEALEAMTTADPRTRDSIWHGVALAFAALADPNVMHAITPTDSDTFNPAQFLHDSGTLYLLATGAGAGAAAALVSAFIEDLTETARRIAATAPAARLDPPLLLALDEIGNLAPLPSLPILMADGGGSGITTMPVLQSLAQARSRWGEHAAAAIWDAAIVKVILGGTANSRDLTDLSALLGERDEPTVSMTTDTNGSRSYQHHTRRTPVLPAETIRTLPFGTGLILLRTARPIIATLRPWTSRPDHHRLTSHRDTTQTQLRTAANRKHGSPGTPP